MAKKIQFKNSITQNVSLLYFLFIATLLHLGYFLFTQETLLLASFSLAVIFVYLVNPNMVIVLAVSLIFVDLLYLVRKVPEGFTSKNKSKTDDFVNKADDSSGNDTSGNENFENYDESDPSGIVIKEKFTDSEGNPLTLTNLFNKVKDIHNSTNSDEDLRNSVNTLVGMKGVITEKLTENSLEDVDKDSSNVKSLISTVKEMSPEFSESLKALNSIDINELNKLINNLNSMTKDVKHQGC